MNYSFAEEYRAWCRTITHLNRRLERVVLPWWAGILREFLLDNHLDLFSLFCNTNYLNQYGLGVDHVMVVTCVSRLTYALPQKIFTTVTTHRHHTDTIATTSLLKTPTPRHQSHQFGIALPLRRASLAPPRHHPSEPMRVRT